MNIMLFSHDVIGAWVSQLKLFSIPAVMVGAAVGFTLRRWMACLVVSYVAALGVVYWLPHGRFHHPMGLSELMIWSVFLALPAILTPMSFGYFAVRWFQRRRAKQQIT